MLESKLKNALKYIITILNSQKVDYVISGGFAAHLYGSKRPVNDIDIDIADADFPKIYPEIKEYLVFGPGRYTDKKWDLELMTLDFEGQEIDIGGGTDLKLYHDDLNEWRPCPTEFLRSRIMDIEGDKVFIADPQSIIDYKTILCKSPLAGTHQQVDIEAMQKFIDNEKTA